MLLSGLFLGVFCDGSARKRNYPVIAVLILMYQKSKMGKYLNMQTGGFFQLVVKYHFSDIFAFVGWEGFSASDGLIL